MSSIRAGGATQRSLSTALGNFTVVDDGTYLLFQVAGTTQFQVRKSDKQFMIEMGVSSDTTLS